MSERGGNHLPTLGVVLAGGLSTRMGRDKALVGPEEGAESFVVRAVRLLAPLVERVIVVRAEPVGDLPENTERIADPRPGAGPLQALRHAFLERPARRWLVAPCDMPRLEAVQYRRLLEEMERPAEPPPVACYVGKGRLEPLVAVYDQSCLPGLSLPRGDEVSLQAVLRELGAQLLAIPENERCCFANVNTPSDLASLPPSRSAERRGGAS